MGCMLFRFFVGKPPERAKCTKKFNIMDMEKVKEILSERKVPVEII
jgi:hypothetical protein